MSHLLPPEDHPAREMFDVADLVAIGTGQAPVIEFRNVRFASRRLFEANPAARRAFYIAARANDDLVLVSVGRRGGIKQHWKFGQLTRNMRLA